MQKLETRFNALKHGLTGANLFIHDDEREPYQAHLKAYAEIYKPMGHVEDVLVRNIADDYWRSLRGRALEMKQMNRAAFAGPEEIKAISNIALYLNRIERSIKNNLKALEDLQRQRKALEKEAAEQEAAAPSAKANAANSLLVFSNSRPVSASQESTAHPDSVLLTPDYLFSSTPASQSPSRP